MGCISSSFWEKLLFPNKRPRISVPKHRTAAFFIAYFLLFLMRKVCVTMLKYHSNTSAHKGRSACDTLGKRQLLPCDRHTHLKAEGMSDMGLPQKDSSSAAPSAVSDTRNNPISRQEKSTWRFSISVFSFL